MLDDPRAVTRDSPVAAAPSGGGAATDLFGACLFGLAGAVRSSRPTSWIAPGLGGWLAVSCYVLKSEGSALIIDTGLAVHWDRIRAGLDQVLAGTSRRALIMTRREPDAIGNLPAIVARYALDTVYCGGVISPLDFFERVDKMSAASHIRSMAASKVDWLQPGATLSIGSLRLDVLQTSLRVLPKNHLYERVSGTLFSSDTWSSSTQAQDGGCVCLRSDDERLSLASILGGLRHRFGWLSGIDSLPMRQELSALLEILPMQRICPGHGCVIEGAELVSSVVRRTVDALEVLGCEPPAVRINPADRARLVAALLVP